MFILIFWIFFALVANNILKAENVFQGDIDMKATGIVRRIDDLGRVVIPKEIRRTMRIREGDPLQTTLTSENKFIFAMLELSKRIGLNCEK